MSSTTTAGGNSDNKSFRKAWAMTQIKSQNGLRVSVYRAQFALLIDTARTELEKIRSENPDNVQRETDESSAQDHRYYWGEPQSDDDPWSLSAFNKAAAKIKQPVTVG